MEGISNPPQGGMESPKVYVIRRKTVCNPPQGGMASPKVYVILGVFVQVAPFLLKSGDGRCIFSQKSKIGQKAVDNRGKM